MEVKQKNQTLPPRALKEKLLLRKRKKQATDGCNSIKVTGTSVCCQLAGSDTPVFESRVLHIELIGIGKVTLSS